MLFLTVGATAEGGRDYVERGNDAYRCPFLELPLSGLQPPPEHVQAISTLFAVGQSCPRK